MKILISPSKTQNLNIKNKSSSESNIFFKSETKQINQTLLENIDNKNFNKFLEIKNSSLKEQTIFNIKNYETNQSYYAIEFYDGLQFKNIEYDLISQQEKNLLNQSLIIISAYYGIVFCNSYIKPYRLMLGSQIEINNQSLYEFWFKKFNQKLLEINPDKTIINLASAEYSKLIDYSMFKVIDIDFKLLKNGKYVSMSTYSKQCRGNFIKNFLKVNLNIKEIAKLDILGFTYNKDLSNETKIIFTKNYEK
ncbi:MAG: YaaA family protein [Malacoplasma sp.]|nr:YaaA family protein [Malacoplasma sp.]